MIIFYQQSLLGILLQKEDQQIKNHLYQRRTLIIRLPGVLVDQLHNQVMDID